MASKSKKVSFYFFYSFKFLLLFFIFTKYFFIFIFLFYFLFFIFYFYFSNVKNKVIKKNDAFKEIRMIGATYEEFYFVSQENQVFSFKDFETQPTNLNFPSTDQISQISCGRGHIIVLTENGSVWMRGFLFKIIFIFIIFIIFIFVLFYFLFLFFIYYFYYFNFKSDNDCSQIYVNVLNYFIII